MRRRRPKKTLRLDLRLSRVDEERLAALMALHEDTASGVIRRAIKTEHERLCQPLQEEKRSA